MKRFVSILLVLTMILAMSTTAFATNLTISDSTGRTYNGYKLLNLTTSLKCTETHTHVEACYNYAYTVNEKYEAILQTETFNKCESWGDEGKPASAAGVTDAQILAYLASLTKDPGAGDYGTLRPVADSIYRAILDEKIAPDAPAFTGTADIDQGYWLFADVTDLDDENKANSLVMVDTKGQDELTIKPKVGLPTINKKVKDTNDSTGETSDWQDSADYDITDTVPFQLTVTLPENLAGYEEYSIIIHDTMSAGLTLDVNSIKVKTDDGTDVTDAFTLPTTATSTFEISCNDILAIDGVTVTKDTKFVVTYDATLNENAVVGPTGNPNEVYLEFSNDPYGDGTGETEKDEVIVFTYKLVINKVDGAGQALQGAGFTLYKKSAGGEYIAVGGALNGGPTFEWKGLDDGEYKLVETTVPAGYNKMEDKSFTISAEHTEDAEEPALTSVTSTLGTVTDGVISDNVVNLTGTVLPETGAKGTMMLITISAMFIMIATVFMITRKKMSIYED